MSGIIVHTIPFSMLRHQKRKADKMSRPCTAEKQSKMLRLFSHDVLFRQLVILPFAVKWATILPTTQANEILFLFVI